MRRRRPGTGAAWIALGAFILLAGTASQPASAKDPLDCAAILRVPPDKVAEADKKAEGEKEAAGEKKGNGDKKEGVGSAFAKLTAEQVAQLVLRPACYLFKAFSKPEACFTCVVMGHVMVVFEQVGRAAFELLDEAAVVLLGAGFTLWLTVRLARPLLGFTEGFSRGGWPEMSHATIRFLIALVLLGGFTGSGTAEAIYTALFDGLLAPLLAGALYLGQGLMGALIGGSDAANGLFNAAQKTVRSLDTILGSAGISARSGPVDELVKGVMHLVASLHHLGRLGMAYGVKYLEGVSAATGSGAVFATIAGLALVILFTMFLVTSAIRLVDPLLRVTLTLCVAPMLIVAWVFPWSRNLAHHGLRALLYAAVYFILAGIVYGLAFQLIVFSLVDLPYCVATPYSTTVCGLTAGTPDFNALAGKSLDILGVVDVYGNVELFHVVVWVVTLLFAMALMGLVPQVAGMLTDYRVADSVGTQVETQMRGTIMGGVSATAHAVPGTVALFGRAKGAFS